MSRLRHPERVSLLSNLANRSLMRTRRTTTENKEEQEEEKVEEEKEEEAEEKEEQPPKRAQPPMRPLGGATAVPACGCLRRRGASRRSSGAPRAMAMGLSQNCPVVLFGENQDKALQ